MIAKISKKKYQKRKGILESSIRSGNLVLRLNMKKHTKKGHKMEDAWFGPYKVLRMSDTGSCSLYNMKTGTEVKQKVNASQLKLYVESAKKNDKETEAKTKDEFTEVASHRQYELVSPCCNFQWTN